MVATVEGSEERLGELETRDGSDSPNVEKFEATEKSVESPLRSTNGRTEDDLLGNDDNDDDGSSISSTHTVTMDTQSDNERPFNPELPTGFEEIDQTTPSKDVAIKDANAEVDEGKSEEIVPELMDKSSTEDVEASKPLTKPQTLNIDKASIKVEPSSSRQDETKGLEEHHLLLTMLTKKDFKDSGHFRSGRYFLPEAIKKGRKSGLFTNLALMSAIYPCGETYQCCYLEVPMMRFGSDKIDDLIRMRIQYSNNSFVFMRNGYPVGIKVPTETEIEWL